MLRLPPALRQLIFARNVDTAFGSTPREFSAGNLGHTDDPTSLLLQDPLVEMYKSGDLYTHWQTTKDQLLTLPLVSSHLTMQVLTLLAQNLG